MERLAIHLALHGTAVLTLAILAGWFLYLAIMRKGNIDGWHLVHSGGSSRGILLIALAGTIRLAALSSWQMVAAASLMILFVWTSMAAMIIRAITGERGFSFSGSAINRFVWILYAAGIVAVLPGCGLLIYGLTRAAQLQP